MKGNLAFAGAETEGKDKLVNVSVKKAHERAR